MFLRGSLLLSVLSAGLSSVDGQQIAPLISSKDASAGWSFGNGPEFPGARGGLAVDADTARDGRASLKLVGDFTQGGGYVQAGRAIDALDIRELSMWLRVPDEDRLTLRLNDSSGQTHQIVVKTEKDDAWQHVVLPLERFLARRGQADAVTSVAKYESWGGAKDGKWHGPATAIYVLVSNRGTNAVRTLWLNEVNILSRPTAVAGADIKSIIRLDEIVAGTHDWQFTRGAEFKGATGSLAVVADEPAAGQSCLKLSGDFTAGGAYVAAIRNLTDVEASDVPAIRLRMKSSNASSFSTQLVDGSGQTHQRKDLPLTSDGQWQEIVLKPAEIAGDEHWGGANDGRWHAPAKQLVISLTSRSDRQTKQPVLLLADIRAEALLPVFVQPAAFRQDFDDPAPLADRWAVTAGVTIDAPATYKSKALVLARTLESIEQPCSATGPAFAAAPGKWEINLACQADLHSPDNSYHGVVRLECLDAAGQVVERITVAEVFGKRDWQPVKKHVELPKAIVSARFQAQLNKTYGDFRLDDLSAAFLAPAPRRDDRIARLLFSTAQLGNLLFPADSREVGITVEARKPLRDGQQTVTCVVRDYWGAEQMRPMLVSLGSPEKKNDRFVYQASLDLSGVPLEIGRYYELHATIAQEGDEPFRNFTSLAILPEAETKRYQPDEVPFTARNWDNRIPEYIRLTDRLGVRICGLWGGWSSKPPYKPEAPGLDLCRKLGMGWLTTTPIKFIEQGKAEYDEEALRQGVRNFLAQYGDSRPIINLGNEPHGTGDRVQANVAAYKIVYEEIKKIDPTLLVVATSVEPNEEYFKAGYGKWCDAYDFHIYEDSANVRRTIHEYRELAVKYDVPKPIWSTELGLNSQGLTRHTVATELIKKFATFFAAGGTNVSWFGLLYPDPDAKSYGSSGDAHNIFDCRWNRYAPRLDAIAYYNAVNAIAIKKFVEERRYEQGISAFLFRDRDDRSLQVLWKDKGRQDVSLPMPGVQDVQIIRLDGRRRTLKAGGKALTLSISDEPLLLLYQGCEPALPQELKEPSATWALLPDTLTRDGATTLTIAVQDTSASDVNLLAPPMWTVNKSPIKPSPNGAPTVSFTLTPPPNTSARQADLAVTLGAHRQGELTLRLPVAE